jgi:hypothetical protein
MGESQRPYSGYIRRCVTSCSGCLQDLPIEIINNQHATQLLVDEPQGLELHAALVAIAKMGFNLLRLLNMELTVNKFAEQVANGLAWNHGMLLSAIIFCFNIFRARPNRSLTVDRATPNQRAIWSYVISS